MPMVIVRHTTFKLVHATITILSNLSSLVLSRGVLKQFLGISVEDLLYSYFVSVSSCVLVSVRP